jgi:hypothetical protein
VIGGLRWAVELGRIDMCTKVLLLSHHLALPCIGHLETVYHIFAYLQKKHNKLSILFDPTNSIPITPTTAKLDWSLFYNKLEEELPPRMRESLGHSANMHVSVDANHAGNVVTRRSHTGILLFVQNSPILWVSCRQNTAETLTFGSECVTLRTARSVIIALTYLNCGCLEYHWKDQRKSTMTTKEWSRMQVSPNRSRGDYILYCATGDVNILTIRSELSGQNSHVGLY